MNVLDGILPKTGNAIRVGITGAPGVGKSTFIEALGMHLTSQGHKIAVLTIDPSSHYSKGSILGDKTRMEQLSKNKKAYIRPSSSGKTEGGVASHTQASILLCEAAGYDIVIVETVGVGQSQVQVHHMVDFFLLLMMPGAGDELQGIKKGIIEMADALVITKADGENIKRAQEAKATFQNALHYLTPNIQDWTTQVFSSSAINNEGIKEIWEQVLEFKELMDSNGKLDEKRKQQRLLWMENCIHDYLQMIIQQSEKELKEFEKLKQEVMTGRLLPMRAASKVIESIFNQ